MQKTYKGQTATSILKTARIETMKAGNVEIVVKAPGHTTNVFAYLGDIDNLILSDLNGIFVGLALSPRDVDRMLDLQETREKQQQRENDAL